tara:strand:- start:398 stop:541 length:144 start_codon:yes stop_codon:yes gene_type:complete
LPIFAVDFTTVSALSLADDSFSFNITSFSKSASPASKRMGSTPLCLI